MNPIHLAMIAAGLCLVLGGARMMYCGHRHHRPERRQAERRMTRRGPGRRAK